MRLWLFRVEIFTGVDVISSLLFPKLLVDAFMSDASVPNKPYVPKFLERCFSFISSKKALPTTLFTVTFLDVFYITF